MTLQELRAVKKPLAWFWPPQLHWFGWPTLIPFSTGHDEYSRTTLVIGWPFTGRIVIALRYCPEPECWEQSLRYMEDE